jgi:hypothetical protein
MVKNRKASLGKSAIEALFTSTYCFSKKLLHGSQKVKEKKKKKFLQTRPCEEQVKQVAMLLPFRTYPTFQKSCSYCSL